jgi:serine/threonine-protein kinase
MSLERLQETLQGRYRLDRELGRGGMATVYLARDLRHDRAVALKVLHPDLAAALGPERFLHEIRIAAGLQHPHILPVFDSGTNASGGADQLWYTMPYVEGESLRQRLDRERQLSIDDTLRVAGQVLSALHHAHTHGVIHRDIKPENILLQGDQAVLADLGIARAISAAGPERLTETGLSVGTPAYMSPEQAAGERELDSRTDIYSFSAVLYEMLTGELPFSGHTAQAIIARKLTESPPSIRPLRDTVSPALEQAVTRGLARAPADRYRTAAEFADALAVRGAAADRDRPSSWRRWRRLIGAGVGVTGALFLGSLFRNRDGANPALDASVVAVAPFDVLDPKLELWREGLVDLLSRNLDGAGPLRTVAPTVVVRRWSGRADPETARELGRRTGAGLVLYGSMLSTGPDSIRVQATLLDVARGNTIEEWELRDRTDRVDRLTDSLTIRVLQGLGRSRPGGVRLAGYGSRSLPTIKAFLQGEQHLRRSEWDSALVYYERAIALDSTFSPALRRASSALGWLRTGHDSLSNAYSLRAGIHNHGLPLRDSLVIAWDSLFASLLDAGPLGRQADSSWPARLDRLFVMADQLTQRYPSDPEVWNLLGEAGNHLGAMAGRPYREQLASFDRAIALDSAFAPAYIHPIEFSARSGTAAMRKYLDLYLELVGDGPNSSGARLVQLLLDSMPGPADRVRLFQKVADEGLFTAYLALSGLPDSQEVRVDLTRYIAEHPLPGTPLGTPANARMGLARALMIRGHLREGLHHLPENPGPLFAEATLLGAVPEDEVADHIQKRMANPAVLPVLFNPWWASRGDTGSLLRLKNRADSLVRSEPDPAVRWRALYASKSAAAFLDLARYDTSAAIGRLLDLPISHCPSCYTDHITLAQLLIDRQRDQEAWRILRADHPIFTTAPTTTAVLWSLLRGRVAERIGERDHALHSYEWVVGMWRKPDPELQPYVNEAREGLARLTSEQR